jgi:energy-coupling factor transporter ATP-binding protein EcfA2
MTNNDILKKLRVALMLRDDEIVDILKLVDFRISKAEIGAFCRKEGHPKYKVCGDQVLRNFLNGLVIHLRGTRDQPKNPKDFLTGKQEFMKVKEKPGANSKAAENAKGKG